MPVCVATTISIRSFRVNLAIASRSPVKYGLERLLVLPFRMLRRQLDTAPGEKTTSVYIGCSTQVVPSSSKVAMRCSGGTNFGLALSVVTRTKSRIAFFAGPSFQDGSGSAWSSWPSACQVTKGTRRTPVRPSLGGDGLARSPPWLFTDYCSLSFFVMAQRKPTCDMPVSGLQPWRRWADSESSSCRCTETSRPSAPAAECRADGDRNSSPVPWG